MNIGHSHIHTSWACSASLRAIATLRASAIFLKEPNKVFCTNFFVFNITFFLYLIYLIQVDDFVSTYYERYTSKALYFLCIWRSLVLFLLRRCIENKYFHKMFAEISALNIITIDDTRVNVLNGTNTILAHTLRAQCKNLKWFVVLFNIRDIMNIFKKKTIFL